MKSPLAASVILSLAIVAAHAAPEKDEHDHDHDHAAKPATKAHADHHDDHGHDAHPDEVKLTPAAIERHDIRIATAENRAVGRSFEAPGRVAFNAETMAHVGSLVRGRVAQIKVRLGDEVKAGDELLVVESPELGQAQSEFIQRRAAIKVAESAVEPARQAYQRAKSLHEKSDGIALAEVQRRQATLVAAEGDLAAARHSATASEHALRLIGMDDAAIKTLADGGKIAPRYVVRAPLGGSIIEREVTVGELVSPDRDALLVIADPSSVWVLADVPEVRLPDVRRGTGARIKIAATQNVIEGTVGNVSASLDPNTRTGRVRIAVENKDRLLMPGMFARVQIVLGVENEEARLAIPEEAVQTVEGKTVVFVPVDGEENTFAPRPVSVDTPAGGYVVVREGLHPGDKYVATGTFILKAELGKSGAAHEH